MNELGLYVKLGQVMSSRPDFIPWQYIQLFETLQDSLPPWPEGMAENIARESLQNVQNLDFDNVFVSMDDIPLGTATIGQVHRAIVRRDYFVVTNNNVTSKEGMKKKISSIIGNGGGGGGGGGSRNNNNETMVVAIKVMDPHAESRLNKDMSVFRVLCRLALPGWTPVLQEISNQFKTEFDYNKEASSLTKVHDNMMISPFANKVYVPRPIHGLCGKHLLVMEMLEGGRLVDHARNTLAHALGGDDKLARKLIDDRKQGKK